MKCTVTLGHDGSIILNAEDGRSGTFWPYKRTITGARDKYDSCRTLTAGNLLDYLRIRDALKDKPPYTRIKLADDKGLFDFISAVDLYQNRTAHAHMDVPTSVLKGACSLWKKKGQ